MKQVQKTNRNLFAIGQILLGKGLPWAVVDILYDSP